MTGSPEWANRSKGGRTSGCPSDGCSLSSEGPGTREIPGPGKASVVLTASSGASWSSPCRPACAWATSHTAQCDCFGWGNRVIAVSASMA